MVADSPAANPPELECLLAHHLVQTMWDLRQEAKEIYEPFGLSPVKFYLFDLIQLGYTQPSDLAKRLRISLPATSTLIAEFVANGWVTRHTATDDKRYRILRLTETGETLYQQVAEAWKARVVTRYSRLGQDKANALLAIFNDVNGPVEADK